MYCPTFVLLFSYISYGCLTFSIFSVVLLSYFFIRVCWTACGEINLLSQGVIICYICLCPIHGHCYHIIDGVEGRKDPFSSIYCYMENAPAEIYYDFACSLYEYLLNRTFGATHDSGMIYSTAMVTN